MKATWDEPGSVLYAFWEALTMSPWTASSLYEDPEVMLGNALTSYYFILMNIMYVQASSFIQASTIFDDHPIHFIPLHSFHSGSFISFQFIPFHACCRVHLLHSSSSHQEEYGEQWERYTISRIPLVNVCANVGHIVNRCLYHDPDVPWNNAGETELPIEYHFSRAKTSVRGMARVKDMINGTVLGHILQYGRRRTMRKVPVRFVKCVEVPRAQRVATKAKRAAARLLAFCSVGRPAELIVQKFDKWYEEGNVHNLLLSAREATDAAGEEEFVDEDSSPRFLSFNNVHRHASTPHVTPKHFIHLRTFSHFQYVFANHFIRCSLLVIPFIPFRG